MSDMYLVLRRRLETVATHWVPIDSAVLRQSRAQRGLSYEAIARQIPVAAKTYERWEKRGRVPAYHLDKVASVLALEIERPAFDQSVVTLEPAETQMAALRSEVAEVREMVAELLRRPA